MTAHPSRRLVLGGAWLLPLLAVGACAGPSPAAPTSTPASASPSASDGGSEATRQRVASYGIPASSMALTVQKSPTCGCCTLWMDYARSYGFTLTAEHPASMDAAFAAHDIPAKLQACHVATNADGQVIVGHVGIAQVLEYLKAPPAGSRALIVPGMPVGSPGMEQGEAFDPYEVLLLASDGTTTTFATVASPTDQSI